MSALSWILALPIKAYRYFLSPLLPPACRYQPSCSEYALIALGRHGPLRGSWLTLCRLARCHPWGGYGYDPVPDADSARTGDKQLCKHSH
jgi:putative membrane protein insertion efficiency factor